MKSESFEIWAPLSAVPMKREKFYIWAPLSAVPMKSESFEIWAPLSAVPMKSEKFQIWAPLAAVPMSLKNFNNEYKSFTFGERILIFHAKFSEKGNFAVLAEIESVFLIRPPLY